MAKKILFIEDEPALQQTLVSVMQKEGFEMFSANDGKTALDLLNNEEFDLVLLDLILPKMNGFEILQTMKKEGKNMQTPVIVLTNLETSADIQKAIEFGAMTYLVKANYELPDIVEKIKSFLK